MINPVIIRRRRGKFSKSPRKKALILLFLAVLILAYFLMRKAPVQVNSGIAKLSKVFTEHTNDVWTVKFSPDGNTIASGSVDSTVKVRTRDGRIIYNLKQPSGVTTISFSPDGNFLASAGYDEAIRIWKLSDGTLLKTISAPKGTIWSAAFSPDGKTLASSGEDNLVKLWNFETGALVRTFQGHTMNIWSVKFPPDGSKLASGSFDNSVKIWNVSDGTLIRTLEGHTQAIVDLDISADGNLIATGSDDKTIKIWSMSDGRLIRTLTETECVDAVKFSPDGKRLLTGGRDKSDIGEIIQNFFGDSKSDKGISIRLWNVDDGKLLQTFSEHGNDCNDLDFSPDGQWFVSSSSDKTVELWQMTK